MSIKISARIEPQSSTLGWTHEDSFGRGGFQVVTTGAFLAASSSELNAVVPQTRRKEGMRVWDTSTSNEYICVSPGTVGISPDNGQWEVLTINGGTY